MNEICFRSFGHHHNHPKVHFVWEPSYFIVLEILINIVSEIDLLRTEPVSHNPMRVNDGGME